MVLRRDGEVGEIAGPTDVLFWVGPPAPMQVRAEVNEEEINRIAVGQKAFLRSEAFPGQALRATVSRITPKGDPTRKTFRVYLLLPDDTRLRIGMSVEANIVVREKPQAVVVPAEAIAGNAVQVVNNGRVQRVAVTIGVRGSRNVEIIGDVSRGMAVLSPARSDLADGTKVHLEPSPAKVEAEAPSQATPPADPDTSREPALATVAATDPDSAVISAAISAHIDFGCQRRASQCRQIQRKSLIGPLKQPWPQTSCSTSPGPTSPPAFGKRWLAWPALRWAWASPS